MESILANDCCSNDWALILQKQMSYFKINKYICWIVLPSQAPACSFHPLSNEEKLRQKRPLHPSKNPCLIHITVHILHIQIKAKGNELKLGAAKVSKT